MKGSSDGKKRIYILIYIGNVGFFFYLGPHLLDHVQPVFVASYFFFLQKHVRTFYIFIFCVLGLHPCDHLLPVSHPLLPHLISVVDIIVHLVQQVQVMVGIEGVPLLLVHCQQLQRESVRLQR